ncbi:MAG: lytic transglycosylase domain-containing protein [Paracoccaceae bacterium]
MRRRQLAIILGLAMLACPAVAESDGSAIPDFTFKRVKVGDATSGISGGNAGKRHLVQIDPAEQAAYIAARPKPSGKDWTPPPGSIPDLPADDVATGAEAAAKPKAAEDAAYAWFWEEVPVGIADGAGRFPQAVAALGKGPEGRNVLAPRVQFMQDLAQTHGDDILAATVGTDVSPALVLAVIGIESAGRVDALSSAGAEGLMQLIPATAERFGVKDSGDAGDNIKGGVAYLDWLMNEFDGDPVMVLAAYNAGENAVKGNSGVPPFAETRDYVPKVLAAWTVARGLCVTPPELVSDGCVFAVKGAG